MSIVLQVVTTSEFENLDSVEEFLKTSGAFQPWQVNELLDDYKLVVEADDPHEGVIGKTKNVFTLKEK